MAALKFSLPLLFLLVLDPSPALAAWQTLSGEAPVIIANGGTSGLYPDQTEEAYIDALNYSLPGVILSCDLQIAKSLRPGFESTGTGICRSALDLQNSTTIARTAKNLSTWHIIDNQNVTGYFAVDIPYENLTVLALATQSNLARASVYDGEFQIIKPDNFPGFMRQAPSNTSTWWLNSEFTHFIEENSNFNVSAYLLGAIPSLRPGYVSSTEVSLLQKIQGVAESNGTKVIFKFLDTNLTDPSINETYGTLLQNLTFIKKFASGILVPKSYIWPIDPNTLYLLPHTSLVEDAHRANLEVYVYNFATDQFPTCYNYTFDPVSEILNFIEGHNFSVDGIFSDFPTTASEAISCYASSSRSVRNNETITKKQKVISHNGYSGKYPGATILAYQAAVDAGVDYIDCSVQITSDSVPICRTTVNLLDTTDAVNTPFFQPHLVSYPNFNGGAEGIYTFDLTWDEISSLHTLMYSPLSSLNILRDSHYDGQFGIMTLADFLDYVKNNTVGALIDIQNAVYLRDEHNLAIVDAVADALSTAGLFNSSWDIILQSEDSSALVRLRELNLNYPLMYRVIWTSSAPVSMNASDMVEIKKFASLVNLQARLIEPWDTNYFLAVPPTDLVNDAHEQNLTVYFQPQYNEVNAFAFDLKGDPTLQLHYLIQLYGVDGFVTDFLPTVMNYLKNQCLRNRPTSNTLNFSIPLVIPGDIGSKTFFRPPPSTDPSPTPLVVAEPPLSGVTQNFSPAPAPSIPSAASPLCSYLLLTVLSVALNLVAM